MLKNSTGDETAQNIATENRNPIGQIFMESAKMMLIIPTLPRRVARIDRRISISGICEKKIWNGVVQYQPAKRPSFERRARSNLPVVVIVDVCVVCVLVDSPRSQRSIGPVAFRDST